MNGPPSTGGYMVAAYSVIAIYAVAYAVSLWVRARRPAKDR